MDFFIQGLVIQILIILVHIPSLIFITQVLYLDISGHRSLLRALRQLSFQHYVMLGTAIHCVTILLFAVDPYSMHDLFSPPLASSLFGLSYVTSVSVALIVSVSVFRTCVSTMRVLALTGSHTLHHVTLSVSTCAAVTSILSNIVFSVVLVLVAGGHSSYA